MLVDSSGQSKAWYLANWGYVPSCPYVVAIGIVKGVWKKDFIWWNLSISVVVVDSYLFFSVFASYSSYQSWGETQIAHERDIKR